MLRLTTSTFVVAIAAVELSASPSPSLGFALGSPLLAAGTSAPSLAHVSLMSSRDAACVPGALTITRRCRCRRRALLVVRGGASADPPIDGDSDSDDAESSDDNTASDYEKGYEADDDDEAEAVEAEIVDGPWANAAASASNLVSNADAASAAAVSAEDAAVEAQRSSYFLSAALYSSLILDCLLNKSKRIALFGMDMDGRVAETAALRAGEAQEALFAFDGRLTLSTAVPTASLAAGYALAAGAAFLLSRPPQAAAAGANDSKDSAEFAANTRKRLALGLSIFGIINLLATATSRPYLGLSGAVINGHNALIALNGWSKDVAKDQSYIGDLFNGIKSSVGILVRGNDNEDGGDKTGRLRSVTSATFLFAALSAIIRSIQAIRNLIASGVASASPLSVANLGRLLLGSIVSLSIKDAVDKDRLEGLVLIGLTCLISVCSAGVAIPMILADETMRKVTSDGGKLLLLSLVSGALSLSKILRSTIS